MASTYKDEFADSMEMLSDKTLEHRLWISDTWTDATTNPDQEIKMLEYACGPGHISMVRSSLRKHTHLKSPGADFFLFLLNNRP